MISKWTFGRVIAAGFAGAMVLILMAGGIALVGLRNVVASKDRVINVDNQLVVTSEEMLALRNGRSAATRGYLFTGKSAYRDEALATNEQLRALFATVERLVHTARGRELISQIKQSEEQSEETQGQLIALKAGGATQEEVLAEFNRASQTSAKQPTSFKNLLTEFSDHERAIARAGVKSSNAIASRNSWLIIAVLVGSILLATGLSVLITRRLRQRIGAAVGQVQSSSVELQTTANQQAVGAMEQATAMSEISTTITELLATSRQITDRAQRVSDVAEKTALAGQSGRSTVTSAQESMTEIRHQVDVIVNHMLELGDKSQRIGVVLDIVSELAEQTNILAINSTIEAAGAGESGRRFAVVADEIRKLADRVAQSTKEIRNLIDVVRGAVHTTVIATEIGSKAVDTGSAQFAGVATAFEQIVDLVTTTTEAAREIELSTKQQTTAVEQVNFAVTNVTQTTKDSQASSSQTLLTASQLTALSTQLRLLVEPATVG
jgi:methyl-accepting chemotaxis protein